MKHLILLLTACLAVPALAQTRLAPVRLYKGQAPGTEYIRQDNELAVVQNGDTILYNVAVPTITAFLPAPEKATGAAFVVCPGGGYKQLSWTTEGTNVAQWLADHGIAAFVLKYRLNYSADSVKELEEALAKQMREYMAAQKQDKKDQAAGQGAVSALANSFDQPHDKPTMPDFAADDGRVALAYIRAHAADYGLKPDHIGLMGFSAGARLTFNVAYNHTAESRPDLLAPIYCNVPKDGLPADPAPLFVAAPQYDIYPVPTANEIYKYWYAAKLPAELHYFTGTNHGFGLQANGEPVNLWIKLFYNFLIKTGFIQGSYLY